MGVLLGNLWRQNDGIVLWLRVKVDMHLKVLPSSITDINKVFWHIDILVEGILQQ